jgi:hypothetical protein
MATANHWGGLLLAGFATVALAFPPAGPAAAAVIWIVAPGGNFTARAPSVVFEDTVTHKSLTCGSSAASGTLTPGMYLSTYLPRTTLGTMSIPPLTDCRWSGGTHAAVTLTHLPVKMTMLSYRNRTSIGTVTGIHALVSGRDCTANLDGTSASADDGVVEVGYRTSTGVLTLLTAGGNLRAYDVSGCAGLISSGDAVTVGAAYALSPRQTIEPVANSWSIKPSGRVKAAAKNALFRDYVGQPLDCTTSVMKATLKSGAGPDVGSITAISFARCFDAFTGPAVVKASQLPWALDLISYRKGVTTAFVAGIHLQVSGLDCLVDFEGRPSAKGYGALEATYTSKTGELKLLSVDGSLYSYTSNCGGLFGNGTTVSINTSYLVTPRQTIAPRR